MGLGSRSWSLVGTNNPQAGGKDQSLWVPPPPLSNSVSDPFLLLGIWEMKEDSSCLREPCLMGGTAPEQRELPGEGQLYRSI